MNVASLQRTINKTTSLIHMGFDYWLRYTTFFTVDHCMFSLQITFKPGTNRGLVDTCLDIQSVETYGTDRPWLSDNMIKALILDTIGAGKHLVAKSGTPW